MFNDKKITFYVLRCTKCNNRADDPDNPKVTGELRDKINESRKIPSWDGWMCKCGHYNGLDP